ncbi:S8 family peptidase [Spirosoma montaniterrae]|uniref:Peptidase S8 n=1 Tax=Spirosoma montaniterrae TaxID=1178516 RepID=A0A1P9WSD6_9BACT|nr:S8 family serine peptidase [Spirosoma montaniterrae]AQG78272.1 peptidase S8 [Spirosoma montaniterrae]
MNEEHIILRAPSVSTRDIFAGSGGGFSTLESAESIVAGLSVEVADLTTSDLADITRSPDVVAVAPGVPMKLVEPFERMDVPQPTAQSIAWGVQAVGADTSPFTGNGIVVAVLDTGIDAAHPAFAGVTIIQKDFTGEGDGDQDGHGTHCAGTIFGQTVNGTRIGVATGVRKALIGKVLGENGGGSAGIVNAVNWAVQNGANVISMSLGIDFPGLVKRLEGSGMPTELAVSKALEGYRANVQLFEKLAQLVRAGSGFFQPTLLIAAAGNESRRNVNPQFEIAVSPPAVSDGFISVAALGQSGTQFSVAPFSNTGAIVAGPGVNILSAKPGGGFASMSGTSMATPHVAGIAALWAEQLRANGVLSPGTLTARLIASGVTGNLVSGFDPFDVGTGMVRAPQ